MKPHKDGAFTGTQYVHLPYGPDFTGYTPISTAEELRELVYSNSEDKYYLTNDIDLYSYGYWESFDRKL